jgi:hypothetical protein
MRSLASWRCCAAPNRRQQGGGAGACFDPRRARAGAELFEHCNKFCFEGVVSKRLLPRYVSGPSRNWTKSKCSNWKRDNAERYRLFEEPKKPELSERERGLKKKREELARVQELLQASDLRPGITRELRKHE